MRATPHDSVLWAIEAWNLRDNYVARRDVRRKGHIHALTEAAVVLVSFELVRRIELTLKRNLERHLRRCHGSSWWGALPRVVRESATARHRWTLLQLGQRRAGNPTRISWLSFGDILKVLATLPPADWQACLGAETRRRREFERKIRRVKSFRDHDLAHPKAVPIANHHFCEVCDAIHALPGILCPTEWERFLTLLAVVASLPTSEQKQLADELAFSSRDKAEHIRRWLACPDLEPPEECKHHSLLSRNTIVWRRKLLAECAGIDFTRHVFFTYGEPLSC